MIFFCLRAGLRFLTLHFNWVRLIVVGLATPVAAAPVTFVFTSDVHFGITRGYFRGGANVDAAMVNAALVRAVNAIPAAVFPADTGLSAGQPVGAVEFAVITGDLTSRMELYPIHIQSATASWAQFNACWIEGLALKDSRGARTPLWLVPGNHDVSNAIGSPSKMVPATDATALVEIYNRMMRPAVPRTKDAYDYAKDPIIYAHDVGGAHLIFLTIWPGSAARAWIEEDLKKVPAGVPVFIFCHDPPEIDARHLTNPYGKHDINSRDKYENVVGDIYAGVAPSTPSTGKPDGPTLIEQRALAKFLKAHRSIVGYFHGHSNWTEFSTWQGPDTDLALNVFRADSPMKGSFSGKDETKLSFQVVVFDAAAGRLTARECLWNTRPQSDGAAALVWGESRTVSIAVP
jgi:hypothetical protein